MTDRHRRRVPVAAVSCLATLLLVGGCTSLDVQGKQSAAAHAQANAARSRVALKLARAARNAGDLASAVSLYKTVLESEPNNNTVRIELGESELKMGTVDDAIATFDKVPAKSPSQLDATLGLERAHLMLREPTKALRFADKAVALAPKNVRAQVGRGVALDMMGRHRDAQICYHAAIAIAPHDIAARSDLALSLALTGQYDKAIAIMTPIARDPSATPRLRQNLALIYGLKGDNAAARSLSRVDLDKAQTQNNLKFFAFVRDHENQK